MTANASIGPNWQPVITDSTHEVEYRRDFARIEVAAEEIDLKSVWEERGADTAAVRFEVERLHHQTRADGLFQDYDLWFTDDSGQLIYVFATFIPGAAPEWSYTYLNLTTGWYRHYSGRVDFENSTIEVDVPSSLYAPTAGSYRAVAMIGNMPTCDPVCYVDYAMPGVTTRIDMVAPQAKPFYDLLYEFPPNRS